MILNLTDLNDSNVNQKEIMEKRELKSKKSFASILGTWMHKQKQKPKMIKQRKYWKFLHMLG